ncbi:alkene reductase [Niastella koreensis]|uniref:12-oxophytodienoate reductase n=2 Tax=Niastella koreensis TaxID=354356 RepID=G8TRH6_NIAKG|nr:alkene reductase [Niastella koreensis]AEW01107.1 12-oxophytodienoate reductase [Niastella koreensis GR20-10]OQP41825.1 alkene reductase [Niastella koreensis]
METSNKRSKGLSDAKLFSPVKIGAIELAHRVVMAPLTRMRTDDGGIPNDLMAQYYSQRATTGGFIIAESTLVSTNGQAYRGAPGIYNKAQTEGWKKISNAIHAQGAKTFLQLWHGGRMAHSDLLPDGGQPIGPSVVAHDALAFTTEWVPATPNKAATIEEIQAIVRDFRVAAENAKAAGFDGIELHGANGYLIDQFLQDGSNKRTDEYGESIPNRVRLLMEVVTQMVAVFGGDRVGVRLGPSGTWGGMSDSDPVALFTYTVEQLNKFGLAYLHLIEPRIFGSFDREDLVVPIAAAQLRKVFKGPIIAAGGFQGQEAADIIEKGDADLVAFGRHFIANPDLVNRLRNEFPLNPYDRPSFFGGDARGYIDYPYYDEKASTLLTESIAG